MTPLFPVFTGVRIAHLFVCPRDDRSEGLSIYTCPSVRLDIGTWFVRLSPPTVFELYFEGCLYT